MTPRTKRSWYLPDEYAPSLAVVDPQRLYSRGVRACIFDFDNTLITDAETVISDDIRVLLKRWTTMFGARRITIVSNKIAAADFERLRTRTKDLGIPAIGTGFFLKPFPFVLRQAAARMQTPPHETVIVGDLLLADVLGGKLAGMHTILVKPLSELERFESRALRPMERFLLRGTEFYTAE